jgi:hypothetical protein
MTCEEIKELSDAILDDTDEYGEQEDSEEIGAALSEWGMDVAI